MLAYSYVSAFFDLNFVAMKLTTLSKIAIVSRNRHVTNPGKAVNLDAHYDDAAATDDDEGIDDDDDATLLAAVV